MNIFLWIVQILLCLVFLFTGSLKFMMPVEMMQQGSPVAFPGWFYHFIGACEILGAIGLVVPWATGIKKGLTPLAASLLIVVIIGAVVVSAMMSIPMAIMPLIVGLLLVLVAWGRSRGLRS